MTCCPVMADVLKKFPLPFYYPITVNPETMEFKAGRLGVELYTLTPSGCISKKGHTMIYVNYCPCCGAKLSEE